MHSAEVRGALLCQPLWTVLKVWPGLHQTGRTTLGDIRLSIYLNRAEAIAEEGTGPVQQSDVIGTLV